MPNQPPQGVPVYGWEGLARLAGLATAGMLDAERREPAPGQKPAGAYWTGHAWANLWTYADTVAKPPLSPGRQRQWDANRTCTRCAKRSTTPWERARNGKRYCSACIEPAMRELWEAERAADRPGLTAWAREVLADERTVLVAGQERQYVTELRAETVAGDVLLDALVVYPHMDPLFADEMPADVKARAIQVEEVVDQLVELAGRRLIGWWTRSLAGAVGRLVALEPDGRGLHAPQLLEVPDGDRAGRRYSRWVGKWWGRSVLFTPVVAEIPAAFDPVDGVAQIRAALTEMAAGHAPPAEGKAGT